MADCPIYVVDSFTTVPFTGNPAGVCVLPAAREDDWMTRVAAELNHPETAFVVLHPGHVALRWFTPRVEVALCGHATLASAHALWTEGFVADGEPITFSTKSGDLRADRDLDGRIRLDFPVRPLLAADPPAEVLAAIRTAPVTSHRIDLPGEEPMWMLELPEARMVRELKPRLIGLRRRTAPTFMVTARSDDPSHDFVSRFFSPGQGIDEDPVTGSAHCALAPFWSERLGRDALVGYQASKRGGTVAVRLAGERVHLLGDAITVLRGTLML